MKNKKRLNLEDIKYLKSKMRNEGFDYCFESYSNWEEIKDKRFHELRKNYLESKKLFADYINDLENRLREKDEEEFYL
jgi:hypothetical protein